jgi:hypothetical protein
MGAGKIYDSGHRHSLLAPWERLRLSPPLACGISSSANIRIEHWRSCHQPSFYARPVAAPRSVGTMGKSLFRCPPNLSCLRDASIPRVCANQISRWGVRSDRAMRL